MALNPDQFAKIAESLRQYRRAELSDFEADVGGNPVDMLYVDPLESDAVLKTVTLNHTTFLVGRKGTGKSTVFAKAQIELRKRTDAISVYVDVKSLHELLSTNEAVVQSLHDASISEPVFRAHSLRKNFLAAVVSDLIKELKNAYETRSLVERWIGKARGYQEVIGELEQLAVDVRVAKLSQEEIPILRMISAKTKEATATKESSSVAVKVETKLSPKPELKTSGGFETFDESIADNEIYQEYADAVLRSFPFQQLLDRIRELLAGVGLVRLFVFFDDFSELAWIEQKLFVDVILSPLNNASDETIKLKGQDTPGGSTTGRSTPAR
jgi:hypothetical protein